MTAGRSQARVYADVNEKFGRAWWDYGTWRQRRSISSEPLDAIWALSGSDSYLDRYLIQSRHSDNLAVAWGTQDSYEIVRKVGRGKYSEVFEGVNIASDDKCIIKVRSCALYLTIRFWPIQL